MKGVVSIILVLSLLYTLLGCEQIVAHLSTASPPFSAVVEPENLAKALPYLPSLYR